MTAFVHALSSHPAPRPRIWFAARACRTFLAGAGVSGDALGGAPQNEKAERGLRFICLNANISRQFEFIQTAWIENPKFDGLDERDPLVGGRAATAAGMPTDGFSIPQDSGMNRRITRPDRFHHGSRRRLFLHAQHFGAALHQPDQLKTSSPVGSMCGVLFIR